MATSSMACTGSPPTLDDLLGPPQRRYFGEGYKRAEHQLTAIAVDAGAHGRPAVSARAGVRYPVDWSRKGAIDQTPHLGTTDVLLIAIQLCETYLLTVAGLSQEQLGRAVLRTVRIKAGNAPVEHDLHDFPVSVSVAATAKPATRDGLPSTALAGSVGPLRFRFDIDHPRADPGELPARYDTITDVLGDPRRRYAGSGFTRRSQTIADLRLNRPALTGWAQVGFDDSATPDRGMGWRHGGHAAALDCFVVSLQLAQILLYELDDITRADSHTLWMRRTAIDLTTPKPMKSPVPASTRLENPALLSNCGATWRSVDIVGELPGVAMRCAVAHRLPSPVAPSRSRKAVS
jgi:hypothetical protein